VTRRPAEAGFSLVELAIVLGILSILLRVGIPAYQSIRREAVATQALGDFETIRAAAVAQFEATGAYAPDASSGRVPSGMAAYLPRNYTFQRRYYDLDWDHYTIQASRSTTSGEVIAITVVVAQPDLGLAVLRTLGSNTTHWSVGNAHSFVIFSTVEADGSVQTRPRNGEGDSGEDGARHEGTDRDD
jgi:prepilin-type N-terminal cleavage/methylation domain-containing protein